MAVTYTGERTYAMLVQINKRTGLPTGLVKPNVPSDSQYIAPFASNDCADTAPPVDYNILTEQEGGIPILTEVTSQNLEIEH